MLLKQRNVNTVVQTIQPFYKKWYNIAWEETEQNADRILFFIYFRY